MANLFNGDYTITDDNGDLAIKGPNDTVLLRYNETASEWEFSDLGSIEISDITDTNSNNSVYDSSSETVGDGNQSLNVSDGTVDGDALSGFPSETISISPGFGTFIEADATRPAFISLNIEVETDGSSTASVAVQVDESGGTSKDYSYNVQANNDLPSGASVIETLLAYIPAGGKYRVLNSSDPNGNNSIVTARQITL